MDIVNKQILVMMIAQTFELLLLLLELKMHEAEYRITLSLKIQ